MHEKEFKVTAKNKNIDLDNPPILYICNIGSNTKSFEVASNALSSEYSVIQFDPNDDIYINEDKSINTDNCIANILKILDINNLNAIHIISNGVSAYLACIFALKYPDYVKSMIFEDYTIEFNIHNISLKLDINKIVHPTLLLRGSKSKIVSSQQNQTVVMSNQFLRSSSVENVEMNGHSNNVDVFVSQVSKFISIYS